MLVYTAWYIDFWPSNLTYILHEILYEISSYLQTCKHISNIFVSFAILLAVLLH